MRASADPAMSRPGGGGGGGGSGAEGMPANAMPKWKRDHAAFQAALKAGRQVSRAQVIYSSMGSPEFVYGSSSSSSRPIT